MNVVVPARRSRSGCAGVPVSPGLAIIQVRMRGERIGVTTIAAVGEVVADAVLPADGIRDHEAHLTVHPGGGSAKFSIAVPRPGTTARFAGRLSTGSLGQLCRSKLADSGVDLSASIAASEPATLAIAR